MLALSSCTVFTAVTEERGVSGALSDSDIRLKINGAFMEIKDDSVNDIEMAIYDGTVLLVGIVKDQAIKDAAYNSVQKIEGVKKIINNIQVGKEDVGDYMKDSLIAYKLKTVLFADVRVLSQNYQIKVIDKVVYILGVAQNKAELDEVIKHAEGLSSVRSVVSYVEIAKTTTE